MPYHFGRTSLENLEEAHPDLQRIFYEVIKHVDCKVIEGFRGKDEQTFAYESGKSKVQWPNSKHNVEPAMAVDVVPWPLDWDDLERFALFGGFVMWVASRLFYTEDIDHMIRWGADWDSDGDIYEHSLVDFPHFELIPPGESIYG